MYFEGQEMRKKIIVITWNGKSAMLPHGKILLQHLFGTYYTAQIGYLSLLNLDYCIYFVRPAGYKGVGSQIVYNLLKNPHASRDIKSKSITMKQGIVSVLPRKKSLRILVRQIRKEGATNLPLHRHNYQFVAVCLMAPNGEIIDMDSIAN